jgi:Fe2+ or Zn2+ uptake regulation protein
MAGIPPGSIEAVLEVLRASPGPLRRREILAALESRGHRISLAGLNRILEHCARNRFVSASPDGVRLASPPP